MTPDEIYDRWVQSRRHVDIDTGFTDRVMNQLERSGHRTARPIAACLGVIHRIGASAWARAAAIGVATVIGIGRILLTFHLLLTA